MTQTKINPRTGKPKYYRGEGKDLKSSAEIQRKRNHDAPAPASQR